jgi:dTDP-4-amino-4,6-dideoxygalactose transaminase
MGLAKSAAKVGYRQAKNLAKLALKKPLTTPSLGSMTLDEDDVGLARAWLKQEESWYDTGPVATFQSAFAAWNGSRCAFAFMSGRVALSACLYALDLKPGDEVILPGYTCVVVPNALSYAGITPVFCDIELDSYGLDAKEVEAKITPNTRAILLHHLFGLVCRDYDAILAVAKRHGLKVIEDCAHATGASYRGVKVGNLGDVAFYSTEQSKVLNTVQGGVATTNDDAVAERLRAYHEKAPLPDPIWIDRQLHNLIVNYYQFKHPGRWWLGDAYNLRFGHKVLISTTREEEKGIRPAHYGRKMPAPIAALGLNQLKKVESYNSRRRLTATKWDAWCEREGYQKPLVVSGSSAVFLRYPVLVEAAKKRDTSWAVKRLGVTPGVWFVSHLHPVPRPLTGFPNADKAVAQCINMPSLGMDGVWSE